MLLTLGAYPVWGHKWHLSFLGYSETTSGSPSFFSALTCTPNLLHQTEPLGSPLWGGQRGTQLLWVRTFLLSLAIFTFQVLDEMRASLQNLLWIQHGSVVIFDLLKSVFPWTDDMSRMGRTYLRNPKALRGLSLNSDTMFDEIQNLHGVLGLVRPSDVCSSIRRCQQERHSQSVFCLSREQTLNSHSPVSC